MRARFEQGNLVNYAPLGVHVMTVSSTPLTLPNLPSSDQLRRVAIRGLGQPWEWSDDGTVLNGSNGFRQLADEIVVYDAAFDTIQLIRASTASADVDVRLAYYGA